MGVIARPGQADRTLRWLKDALGRGWNIPARSFKILLAHSNWVSPGPAEVPGKLDDGINS